jgi:hypothetical protein
MIHESSGSVDQDVCWGFVALQVSSRLLTRHRSNCSALCSRSYPSTSVCGSAEFVVCIQSIKNQLSGRQRSGSTWTGSLHTATPGLTSTRTGVPGFTAEGLCIAVHRATQSKIGQVASEDCPHGGCGGRCYGV